VAEVPGEWLGQIPGDFSADQRRAAYVDFLRRRLEVATVFEQEATSARARLL
jgi:hypothetical protein